MNTVLAWVVSDIEELQSALFKAEVDDIDKVKPKKSTAPLKPLVHESPVYGRQLNAWKMAYLDGFQLDWEQMFNSKACRRVHLPNYHFDTKPYWFKMAEDTELMKQT